MKNYRFYFFIIFFFQVEESDVGQNMQFYLCYFINFDVFI